MAYDVKFLRGTQAGYAALANKDPKTFYFTTETVEGKTIERLYIGNVELSNTAADSDIDDLKDRLDTAEANIGSAEALSESLKAAITRLNGDETVNNSVAKKIKDAIDLLNTTTDVGVASKTGKAVTISGSIKEKNGIIAKGADTDITLADVASTGNAEDVIVATIEGVTGTDAQTVLESLKGLIDDAEDAGAISLNVAATATEGYLKTYVLSQGTDEGATEIGKIDIPKDYLVKSGRLVTDPEGQEAGTYIELTLNVKDGATDESKIYINVAGLVDIYTGAADASEVQISVNDYEISASIVDVDAAKITYIAADAEADPAVARESVKAALTRIDGGVSTTGSIEQKVNAITGTLSALQTTNKDNLVAAINEVRNSATGVTEVATPGAEEGANGQIKVTTKAANGTTSTTYATPKNLKAVATTGAAADVSYGASSNVAAELDKIKGDVSTEGSIAKAQADAVATAIGEDSDAKTANTIYGAKAYAEDAVNTLSDDLVGDASDETTADTINGAKNFASDAADTAEANANSYTDDALTWSSF